MKTLLSTAFTLCISSLLTAQDYHYWSDQFGIKPSALGGAVTAGMDDHAMVYYNPAAMSEIQHPSLSVSVNAYQYNTFTKKNAIGPGQDVSSSGFSTLPNLLAGIYLLKKHPRLRLGYHVISTNHYNNKLDLLHRGDYDAVASTAGTEHFVGTYGYHLTNEEYWAGIGISYQLLPFLSVGLTHMGTYKNVTYTNLYQFTAQPEDPSTGEISQIRSDISLNYYTVNALFKPSLQLKFPKLRIGVTYTTPSISIYGRGNFYREMSIVNLNDVISSDVSWIDREERAPVKHASNGSLAYGIRVQLTSKSWLYLSGESFFAKAYYLIRDSHSQPSTYPTYFDDSTTTAIFGNQNFLSLGEAYKPVTNLGIGLDLQRSEQLGFQLGFRTDFNYNRIPTYTLARQVIESTQYDRLISSIGANYAFQNGRQFSLCFEFGWAIPKTTRYEFDFTTPDEARNGLSGDSGNGTHTYAYTYRLMLGIKLEKKKTEG